MNIATIFKSLIGTCANTTNDVVRNRLINKHTPKGISLIVAGLSAVGYISKDEANAVLTILSGSNISYSDIYLAIFNVGIIYLLYRGFKLLLRYSDCVFEEKIINKHKQN